MIDDDLKTKIKLEEIQEKISKIDIEDDQFYEKMDLFIGMVADLLVDKVKNDT